MTESISTSDGVARPNGMTADQWLDQVLYSGQVTRVAQHLALVIFAIAVRQKKNGVSASVRDLERITGWGRSKIHDNLKQLRDLDVVHVELFGGRAKSVFELQGMIEDAIGAALASGMIVRQPDTNPVVSVPERTQTQSCVPSREDTNPDANPDAKPSVLLKADANPDTTVASGLERTQAAGCVRPSADANPDATLYREREKDSEREKALPVVQVNCTAIYGPGFTLDFAAIDMAASLSGVPVDRARQIAEICARDWAANGTKPASPMAMVKRAIASDRNHKQTDDARAEREAKSAPASKRERIRAFAEEAEAKIKAEKQRSGHA